MTSRRTFMLGAGTVLLGGCTGSGASGVFRPRTPEGGRRALSDDSIARASVRSNPLPHVAHSQARFRKRFAAGSSIYYYSSFMIHDGMDYAMLPASATLTIDADGLYAYNGFTGATASFSPSAKVTFFTDAGEFAVAQNQRLHPALQRLLDGGYARLVGKAGSLQSTSDSRHTSTFDPLIPDGGYYDPGIQVAAYSNVVTSAHNQCTTGGENIGVSFTVPSSYSGNVNVSICVNNGTTDVCYVFQNEAPGSSHNVSMWIAGSGGIGMSVGIQPIGGSMTNGLGWAQLSGC